MANLKQNTDQSLGISGSGGGDGGFITLHFRYDANSVDQALFRAHRKYIVKDVACWPTVAGTDGAAVTVSVKKIDSGSAINTGTKVHTSTMDVKGTINTAQVMTLATDPADRVIAAGQWIGLDFAGTLTAAVGSVSITLAPA